MGFFSTEEEGTFNQANKVAKKHKDLKEEEKNAFTEILTHTGKVSKDTEYKLKKLSKICVETNNTQDILVAENLIIIGMLDELINKRK